MKKTLLIIFVLACTLMISSCNISDLFDQIGSGNGEMGDNTPAIEIEDESYKVYKQETTLTYSYSDEVNNYFVFKIGEVARVPLAYHASEYHSGVSDTQYTFSNTIINSTTLSKTEAELMEYTVSAGIEASLKAGVETETGISFGGVGASVKTTLESQLSNKLDSESKITNSNENRRDVVNVQESRKEKTVTIDKSSPKGHYWYAICTSCDIYVALVCNRDTGTCEYDIFTTSVGEKYDAMIYSGDRDRLDPDIEEKLNFDPSIFDGMNLLSKIEKETASVKIDLDSLTEDCDGEGYVYKKSEGVLYLYGAGNGKYYTTFKLAGSYGKRNDRDHVETKIIDKLSIVIDTTHDLSLIMECVAFKSTNYRSAISCTNESKKM